jgi:hypothetical protein
MKVFGNRRSWLQPAVMMAAVVAALVACQPTISSHASPTPSTAASSVVGDGLPPDCKPMNLRDPNGRRVDLTGEWEGSGDGSDVLAVPDEQVWLQQIGDCLFGSVHGVYPGAGGGDPETFVVDLGGGITPDFTVDLEVVFVHQDARFPFTPYSTMEMAIEWDSRPSRSSTALRPSSGIGLGRVLRPDW